MEGPDVARFWVKVNKAGPTPEHCPELGSCWEWRASRTKWGYGHFYVRGKDLGAHRASWVIAMGAIPQGLCICHHCDNPPCVNPAHLFLGTHKTNAEDKYRKGRQGDGRTRRRVNPNFKPRSKVTVQDIRLIRERFASGEATKLQIATEFGICRRHVQRIVNGWGPKSVSLVETGG